MLSGCHSTSREAPPLPQISEPQSSFTNSESESEGVLHPQDQPGTPRRGELLLSPPMEDKPCQEGQNYLEMYH